MNRRTFLEGTLLAGAALASGACSGSGGKKGPSTTEVTRGDKLEGDLSLAALLVSMENLLVYAYQDGLNRKDKLGPYPAAIQTAIEELLAQHKEHATAWNSVLTGAGKPGITGTNLTVKAATIDPQLFRAKDTIGYLAVCSDLENLTSITYLATLGAFENVAALKVAASIHPVECQHVAALGFLLGRNPAAEAFAHPDGARTPNDAIG